MHKLSMSQSIKINKERLLRRAIKMGHPNVHKFKYKNHIKIVNRRNINNKLKHLFPNEKDRFTKSDLNKATKLNDLSHDDLKNIARFRKIKKFNSLSKRLYYTH